MPQPGNQQVNDQQVNDPDIKSTYHSSESLAEALVSHRLSLFQTNEITTTLSEGQRVAWIKDREALFAMRNLLTLASNPEQTQLRIAIYKFVWAHEDLKHCLKGDAQADILAQSVQFRATDARLEADKDLNLEQAYDGGDVGLISALYDYKLEVLHDSDVMKCINIKLASNLRGMDDLYKALQTLANEAALPKQVQLRFALLKFVQDQGTPVECYLTQAGKTLKIRAQNPKPNEKTKVSPNLMPSDLGLGSVSKEKVTRPRVSAEPGRSRT